MPTVRGALAVQLNAAIRAIVKFTIEQHDHQKLGGDPERAVQIRRGVTTAWGLKMILQKRMKKGGLNSLFRAQP